MTRAPEKRLGDLHTLIAEQLITKVASGEATAAEMANAIRFLKDNGIEALPTHDNALGRLVDALPDFPDVGAEGLPN